MLPQLLATPAAAPEVPAAVLFVVSAVAFLTFLIIYMLRFGAGVLIRGLLGSLASFLPTLFGIRHSVEHAIDYVGGAVDDALGAAASAAQGVAVQTFNDAWKLTRWVGSAIANLAVETAHGFKVLVTSTIPAAVHDVTEPITRRLGAIEARVLGQIDGAIGRLDDAIAAAKAAAAAAIAAVNRRVRAAEHAISSTIPAELGRVESDIRGWTSKQIRRLSRRVSRVEAAVGLTALAGVIVTVIAKELPWIRCRNVGKVGRALCGTSTSSLDRLLEDALLATTLVVATIDLIELSRELQPIIADTATVTQVLLGVAPVSDLERLSL